MNLERTILTILLAAPRALTVEAVQAQAPRFAIDPTLAEIKAALRSLEAKGHAKGVSNEDFGTLWRITDEGRLRLA